MPGVGGAGAPSLSEIRTWDIVHLETAAKDWAATAEHWESSFTSIHHAVVSPGGTVWEGAAAEAAQQRTLADLVQVRGLADVLHESAAIARRGADTLFGAKQSILEAVEDARANGYAVGEDLSVTPSRRGPLGQAQAQAYAADIGQRAAQLAVHDRAIAAKITTATAPLDRVTFHEPPTPSPRKPTIQAVDRHIPLNPPTPTPPTDPAQVTPGQLQAAYDKLKGDIRDHNSRLPPLNDSDAVATYNREADVLNARKAALEAKLGKAETVPAQGTRLVPDWAQPAPEQPQVHPPTPRPAVDITTPHAHDLGTDPATGGVFNPDEAATGLRVEAERGIDLIRSSHPRVDWIDPATGDTYDAVGPVPAQFFDAQWPNLQDRIRNHLIKAVYVPVDVSTLTASQRAIVREFVDGLRDLHVFIVGGG